MLLVAIPAQGIAAASAMLCKAMAHDGAPHSHEMAMGGDEHGSHHGHDRQTSPAQSHCGPCAACCVAAIAAPAPLLLLSEATASPPCFTPPSAASFTLDTPDRPPLGG